MSAIRSERGVMVPLRQLVPLPNTTITVDIGRELSKRAVDAARAGKHVLVEKPLATSREDVNAIVQAAKQNGVRVMCDLHNRVNPPFALARQRIAGGELGEVRSLYMRMNDACSVATEMLSWAKESSILWFVGRAFAGPALFFKRFPPEKSLRNEHPGRAGFDGRSRSGFVPDFHRDGKRNDRSNGERLDRARR